MNLNNLVLHANGLSALNSKLVRIIESSTNSIPRSKINLMIVMLLILTVISFIAPTAHAAKLLFRSNLGSGISLGPLYNFTTNGAWQALSGTDKETGYTWPVSALGSDFSGVQLITVDPITSSTIGNYISNEIRSVTGPKGNLVNEIFQNVKIKGSAGQGGSQAPLLIKRPFTIGDVKDLYITYWFKYPLDFPTKLSYSTKSAANWRTQFEFKTGGYGNIGGSGDYRIIVFVMKGPDGQLYWQTKGDNVAGAFASRVDYWYQDNHTVDVPIDKWFKFEVYWHRSSGSDGRFWAAVDGEVIADYQGPNMGDYNLPINRIMVNNPYSGGYATVESHSTGLEIWDGFPCGNGVSCYKFDTIAPTIPTSLVARMSSYSTSAGISLSWIGSSDNVGVAGYNVYRNGTKIGVTTATSTSYRDVLSGSAKGSLYSYTVKSFDAAENLSSASPAALVTY